MCPIVRGVGGVAFNAVSQEFTISGKPRILVEFEYDQSTPWQHGVNAIFVKPDDPEDLGEKFIWAATGNIPDINTMALVFTVSSGLQTLFSACGLMWRKKRN